MALKLTINLFFFYWGAFFGIILVRYFLIAGGMHWFFYSLLKEPFDKRGKPPLKKAIRKDIELSILSAVIFAFCAALILLGYDGGLTLLYTDLNKYSIAYLGISFIAVLLLQDTYFYFTHRLFHRPLLFKWLHQGHHRSAAPTPWTSFAFDPAEAIAQALFLVGIVFIVPLHFITLIAVAMTMTVWSVFNHLGFELFSSSSPYYWLCKWFIGPRHHSIHHRKYTVHYGLYFTFWDKLLGTHDPSYQRSTITNQVTILSNKIEIKN